MSGYVSQSLTEKLAAEGVALITGVRKNIKAKASRELGNLMISNLFNIEAFNDQLKNIPQIEHSRHRSLHGFMLNMVCGLLAYCLKKKISRHHQL
uniref:transposase n=1 Tax=Budvicia aquatica TaxID=82979 RepID=UPI0021C4A3D2|nr:transposase [Budvicia aquatica]